MQSFELVKNEVDDQNSDGFRISDGDQNSDGDRINDVLRISTEDVVLYALKTILLLACMSFHVVVFVNGVEVSLFFAEDNNGFWAVFLETSGWQTIHHIVNWCIQYFISPSIAEWFISKFNVIKQRLLWLTSPGITAIFAITGELIEQLLRKILGAATAGNPKLNNWIKGYSDETLDNVVIGDLGQWALASSQSSETFIQVYKRTQKKDPSKRVLLSSRFYKYSKAKIMYRLFIFLILFPLSGFMLTLRTNIGGYLAPFGFYGCVCFMFWVLLSLYHQDLRHTPKEEKKHVRFYYGVALVYLGLQFIGTGNLLLPGFITSNVISIAIWGAMFILNFVNK